MTLEKVGGLADPAIFLAAATAGLVTVCLVSDPGVPGCAAQTAELLLRIETMLAEMGSSGAQTLMAQVWLGGMADRDGFLSAWNRWVAPEHAPALSIVQAAAYSPEALVEIRVYAAR